MARPPGKFRRLSLLSDGRSLAITLFLTAPVLSFNMGEAELPLGWLPAWIGVSRYLMVTQTGTRIVIITRNNDTRLILWGNHGRVSMPKMSPVVQDEQNIKGSVENGDI